MLHIDASKAIREIKALHSHLTSNEVSRAISLAFNATLSKQKTFLRKEIQAKYPDIALSVAGFNAGKGIEVKRATRRKVYAVLTVSSKRIPLVFYKAKQIGDPANGEGVSVEVLKGKRKIIPFAFLVKGRLPRKQVMAKGNYGKDSFNVRRKRVRSGKSDLPITTLVGPAVGRPDEASLLQAQENIIKDLPQQLGRFFQKISTGTIR
jgi:hypothetical protein